MAKRKAEAKAFVPNKRLQTESYRVTFKNAQLLSYLNEDDLKALLGAIERTSFKAGQVLITEGEPQKSCFFVIEGELSRSTKSGKQQILKSGEVSGLLHFYANDPAHATVTVAKDSTVGVLTRDKLQTLLAARPTLNTGFIQFLSIKVRESLNKLSALKGLVSGTSAGLPVAFFDTKPYMKESFLAAMKAKGYTFSFTWYADRLTAETAHMAAGHKVVCCFVSDVVDENAVKLLAEAGVEMIAMRCAGYDNVALKTCAEKNLSVTRVPAYSPYAVAEFTVMLMLALNRKIIDANSRVGALNFSLNGLVGFDMRGKTVGIVGTGKIGRITANILLGFGCKILCYDIYVNEELAAKENVKYVSKEELFKASDIISLHAPLVKATFHTINKEAIDMMKPGVIIVNTSRGQLIDSDALLAAVLDRKVGGAGLDVVEGEKGFFYEDLSDKPGIKHSTLSQLIMCRNVIVTSHQAFLTNEALGNIADSTLDSIKEFEDGKKGKELTNNVVQEY